MFYSCPFICKYPFTVWPEPIWIKLSGLWQIPPQHQSTFLEGPESSLIEIPLTDQINLVKVPLSVNVVKQDLLHKNSLWKFYKVRSGFQLMLILVLLGMYFDAVVVCITSQTLLFRLALIIMWLALQKKKIPRYVLLIYLLVTFSK